MKTTAIVLAAGKGTRMGSDVPKQYMEVNGKPVLCYSLESFQKSGVSDILIVTDSASVEFVKDLAQQYGISRVIGVITGGRERCFSVLNALRHLAQEDPGPDYVLIHDGARPYITSSAVDMLAEAVTRYGAVVAASPSKDTIKLTDREGFVEDTTDRAVTWCAQTPQCFEFASILEAYERIVAPLEAGGSAVTVTDDSMVYEKAFPDKRVKLIDTGSENGKITTIADLEYMKYFFRQQ
ncbi:MAG: 2-C-methyl-D-erythritol 4-phosphate cytidylyltransferase [Lachnospiraceae bacterium]|nr:2-C-methyl-D-erythritol 4-phosphate cytidylyltransferase [Lachnospiraceae bacterium]